MVQFQTDVDKMPIENPLIRWDEKISPFHKLATIVIPRQHFDGAREMEEGDNLSFNPWHCLPEHRPLGGINRSRKKVYEVTSEVRHRRNQTAEVESAANFEPEPFGDERSPKMLVER